jgi:type II secretory pathway pseudopilin PulG
VDKKFIIALIIIAILSVTLVSILFVVPYYNQHIVNKQIEAQKTLLEALINYANTNGYVVIDYDNNRTVLVKYTGPENPQESTGV